MPSFSVQLITVTYYTITFTKNLLQKGQIYAARIIINKRKFEPITPVLKELHWLPILDKIVFNTLNLFGSYQAIRNNIG